ncbi:Helicase associated domain protein [Streptomyces microflavus]|uniref:Helicase associated domain protein n=1 Tax=Streptomyces microflavus TaxID=1919 RepID=UPI00380AC1F8
MDRNSSGSGPVLRPYQVEADEAIVSGLADGGRGQLHAACGSGKTLISIMAASKLVPGSGLMVVLAPSLSLVAQTVTAWRSLSRIDSVLAVCSDDTVVDDAGHLEDIDAQVSTSPEEIAKWLGVRSGRRLIVGTYLSAHRLAEAMVAMGSAADFLVLDEAHHLAGRLDYATRRVLEEAFLPARRRLFMTATPRIDEVRGQSTLGSVSMSDTTVFGPVLYEYPWARAIREGYLDDYRVVVIGVTRAQLVQVLNDERLLVDGPGAPDLRVLAAQTVIAQAARQHGLRRIIAFSSRLDAAAEFTRTLPSTLNRLPADSRPEGVVHAERVSGDMDHRRREEVLGHLRTPPGGPEGWTVLTNVRCLSEGVDVPAVDAIAFTHPKTSQVDIVQAVGRAVRRSGDEQGIATVIVPIVVPDSVEEVGDLEPGDFRVLWQVLRALRAHDESLGIELDTQASHEDTSNPRLPNRITVELPPGTSDDILAGIKALTVKQTTSMWWTGFGHARAYAGTHGDLSMSSTYVTEDGFALGRWIINARQHWRKGWLRPERVAALDGLGMIWDTTELPWNRFLKELRDFKKEFGHVNVVQNYVSPSGYALGSKINSTRTHPHRPPAAVRLALDELGMIWDSRALAWQQLFTACMDHVREHGHLEVKREYKTKDGYTLGVRLARYRKKWQEGIINPAELASLRELGWKPEQDGRAGRWAEFLQACDRYVARHGSLKEIRKDYVDEQGYALGDSIMYYRNLNNGRRKKNGRVAVLPPERKRALEERGMSWESVWVAKPGRAVTAAEAGRLAALPPEELGPEVIRLIEKENVTQSSIADALELPYASLYAQITSYRKSGKWPRARPRPNLTKPFRRVTAAEAESLAALPPEEVGPEIVRLVKENVTQSSIADALGIARSTFSAQVRAYRESGKRPSLLRRPNRIPAQGHTTVTHAERGSPARRR